MRWTTHGVLLQHCTVLQEIDTHTHVRTHTDTWEGLGWGWGHKNEYRLEIHIVWTSDTADGC